MAQLKSRILSAAITCLLTTAAWADEPQPSAAAEEPFSGLLGERVRLSGPALTTRDEPLIGQVTAVDAETITIVKNRRAGETRRIPFSSIKRLDVGRPEWRSRAGEGALIGMAIPAVALVGVAATARHGDMSDLGLAGAAYIFAVAVPIGAVTGAIVGSQSHTQIDRWERVDTRRRVRVSVLPDLRGGVRGGLSVRF